MKELKFFPVFIIENSRNFSFNGEATCLLPEFQFMNRRLYNSDHNLSINNSNSQHAKNTSPFIISTFLSRAFQTSGMKKVNKFKSKRNFQDVKLFWEVWNRIKQKSLRLAKRKIIFRKKSLNEILNLSQNGSLSVSEISEHPARKFNEVFLLRSERNFRIPVFPPKTRTISCASAKKVIYFYNEQIRYYFPVLFHFSRKSQMRNPFNCCRHKHTFTSEINIKRIKYPACK